MEKKCIAAGLLLAVLTGAAWAADFTLGAYGGISTGWFSGSDWKDGLDYFGADNERKTGFSIAVFLDIEVTENFSIQPELQYTVSGGGLSVSNAYDSDYDVFYDEELMQTANTLNIPVLAKFKVNAGKGRISFFGGPMVSILLGDIEVKYKLKIYGYGSDTVTMDVEADNNAVMGFTIGGGYEFPLGSGTFITDLRYSKTLTGFFDDDDTRANTIGINIGYGFKL